MMNFWRASNLSLRLLLLPFFVLAGVQVYSIEFRFDTIPEIQSLDKKDVLFIQEQGLVNAYFAAKAQNGPLPDLQIFKYKMTEKDSIYSVAAHFNLNWSSISTLNRLPHAYIIKDQYIYIPSIPGIFVPLSPLGNTEKLISTRLKNARGIEVKLVEADDQNSFKLIPGEDLGPKEKASFSGSSFVVPIANARISSGFGMRNNPFTNSLVLHAGLDLVAPVGTPVKSISYGKVRETGFDDLYGNFVIIDHTGGYRSLYAHLSSVKVKKGQIVNSGQVIGTLGSTGQVTGAHLHLEIYYFGEPKDPYPLLFKK